MNEHPFVVALTLASDMVLRGMKLQSEHTAEEIQRAFQLLKASNPEAVEFLLYGLRDIVDPEEWK